MGTKGPLSIPLLATLTNGYNMKSLKSLELEVEVNSTCFEILIILNAPLSIFNLELNLTSASTHEHRLLAITTDG